MTHQEHVAEIITHWVLRGDLRPGQRILTAPIADELSVSPIPVREALHSLEGHGLVQRRSHHGFVVPRLSVADYRDAQEWRGVLEDEAYRRAGILMTDAELRSLKELHAGMDREVERNDRTGYRELNRAFHMVPLRVLGSRRLERFISMLWNTSDLYFLSVMTSRASIAVLQQHHIELIAAFEAHDGPAAAAIMQRHREFGYEVARQRLGDDPRGPTVRAHRAAHDQQPDWKGVDADVSCNQVSPAHGT